jgi:3-hydroxyisobutyrate dehydrogenase-like beta-hydroxyacid dehydrogenase
MSSNEPLPTIAFIGFGEAAQAFVSGWPSEFASTITAYDIKSDRQDTETQIRTAYAKAGIRACKTSSECVADAEVVFSMVTADQALAAGQSIAGNTPKNCFYFDCNSCAPDTKRSVAKIINNAGGKYIDVAVMAPVFPALHKTPVLVSGPAAESALATMARLDMSARHAPGEIGTASSIKMVRSVMIKGLEALVAECVLAGRKAGIDGIVLETLEKTYPGFGWKDRAAYMLERMMVHGPRRAAEMREVALTVKQLGLNNGMSRATTDWQQAIGDLHLKPGEKDYAVRADAILAALANSIDLEE